ncbi:uncharacterized protein LOC143070847 [Mytilus galloprovincialis]|uniref:uncharacterized protein LOC143070847 n=1 Tax=Mytilus galloprovincialis TaxID=29158 RepID=UPI003F7BFCE1
MIKQIIHSAVAAAVILTQCTNTLKAKLQKYENAKNTCIINGTPIRTFIARTVRECASLCTIYDSCYSANFESVSGQCNFYSTFYPNTEPCMRSETIRKTRDKETSQTEFFSTTPVDVTSIGSTHQVTSISPIGETSQAKLLSTSSAEVTTIGLTNYVTGISSTEALCNTATGYTYDTSMNICYKTVVTLRYYTPAKEHCVSDSAHLLLIDSLDVYEWAMNQMDAYGIQRIYFQGERVDQYSPFLDDEGNTLIYFKWNPGEPDVIGNYLRTDGTTRLMETSSGNSEYSYICQIY